MKQMIIGGLVAGRPIPGAAGPVLGAGLAKADSSDDRTSALATCAVFREDFTGNVTHGGAIALGVARAVAEHYDVLLAAGVLLRREHMPAVDIRRRGVVIDAVAMGRGRNE